MSWFSNFKNKKTPCLICEKKYQKKDMVEIKYRYGGGKGTIGTAYMCNTCNDKYSNQEEEDYVEAV